MCSASLKITYGYFFFHFRKLGIVLHRRYSSREEIDEAVQTLTANRHIGANSIMVRLRQMGLHCSREMVRDACRRVDPEGVALRALLRHNIVRRTYRVEHPNALWHVDGNHKLIRYVCESSEKRGGGSCVHHYVIFYSPVSSGIRKYI